jgi:hypothetical protein
LAGSARGKAQPKPRSSICEVSNCSSDPVKPRAEVRQSRTVVAILAAPHRKVRAHIAHANFAAISRRSLLGAGRREAWAHIAHADLADILHLRRRKFQLHCYLHFFELPPMAWSHALWSTKQRIAKKTSTGRKLINKIARVYQGGPQ